MVKKSEHWVPAHMTFWTQSWRPFLIFFNFRHFEAKIIHDSIHLCTYSCSEAQIHSWRAFWWTIGILVVKILKIQPFKVSVLYAVFALATKMSTFEVSYLHIYKARGLKLAILTNWDLIFYILLSEFSLIPAIFWLQAPESRISTISDVQALHIKMFKT